MKDFTGKSDATTGTNATVFVATWTSGLFATSSEDPQQELTNHSIEALAPDGQGGILAIVDGQSLRRRTPDGVWSTIATTESALACCVKVGAFIYAGTDDASVLRINAAGEIEPLRSFEPVPGRDQWFAGSAIIDGKRVGPPLGVRSISATADAAVLLVNVHVGGIPRSADNGATWHPTIDIQSDVHEVRAHPTRPNIVAAASAIGLCTSTNAGATWRVEQNGLHAFHCSAVAFAGDDVLISAATDQFSPKAAIYRRPVDEHSPLVPVSGGLPGWLEGVVDTRCIAVHGPHIALADRNGNLHVSADHGRTWSPRAQGLRGPSSVLIV